MVRKSRRALPKLAPTLLVIDRSRTSAARPTSGTQDVRPHKPQAVPDMRGMLSGLPSNYHEVITCCMLTRDVPPEARNKVTEVLEGNLCNTT